MLRISQVRNLLMFHSGFVCVFVWNFLKLETTRSDKSGDKFDLYHNLVGLDGDVSDGIQLRKEKSLTKQIRERVECTLTKKKQNCCNTSWEGIWTPKAYQKKTFSENIWMSREYKWDMG